MNAWGLGNQHFLDISEGSRETARCPGGFKAKGHLGDAWGLTAAMVFDPKPAMASSSSLAVPGFDPETYPENTPRFTGTRSRS